MTAKTIDTVIVGAGISGLGCAKHLQEFDEDFLLISENIGGRILTSEDGTANYGAFFICSDYYNTLKYVTLGSRIRLRDFCFHDDDDIYFLFEAKLISYLFQFLKIVKILYKFRKALRKFRKNSENVTQRKVIESDSFLYELYMKNAVDFVMEHNLQAGTDTYLSKALYSTTFSTIHEMNAFSFLQFLLPLITPIYRFTFVKDKMIKPFQDKLVIDSVTNVQYENGKYKIKSNKNLFYAKNIVLATEIGWSKNFSSVKKTNKPVSTNMLHILGEPEDIIRRKKYHLFSIDSNVQAIADLEDGTYLFYYKNKQPSLERFFSKYQVIGNHFWDSAGTINGHTLIDSDRGKNMYLIGDFNIAGLEESYITGLYAANQIIAKKSFNH